MKLLDVSRRESTETPEQTLARLNSGTRATTPVDYVPTKPSENFGERLAHISRKQWRFICLAAWPCIGMVAWTVFMLVDAYWPGSTPDDAGVAMLIALGVAVLTFWVVGTTRTKHVDPSEWTTIQRVSKHAWDDLGPFLQYLGEHGP